MPWKQATNWALFAVSLLQKSGPKSYIFKWINGGGQLWTPLQRIKWLVKIQESITECFSSWSTQSQYVTVCGNSKTGSLQAAGTGPRGGYGSAKLVCECVFIMCRHPYVSVCVCESAAGFLGQMSQQWLGQNSSKSLHKWHTSPRVSSHVLLLREKNPQSYSVMQRLMEINLPINQYLVILATHIDRGCMNKCYTLHSLDACV